MNFEKHLAFIGTHIQQLIAAINACDNDGGTRGGDPEAGGGHVDDVTKDIGHGDMATDLEIAEICAEEIVSTFAVEFAYTAKVFH